MTLGDSTVGIKKKQNKKKDWKFCMTDFL